MIIPVQLNRQSYQIVIERGCLSHIHRYINVKRKVFILTDDGVPITYATQIEKQCEYAYIHVIPQGEQSKSFTVYQDLLNTLLQLKFCRNDLVITVGGGVVGDIGGFVASTYMRGMDFINIPTTTLSQIDSSIGGKVAINLGYIKNIVGTFYQPKLVCIDPDTLQTLPKRHYVNGIVEAIKAGLLCDHTLFDLIKNGNIFTDYETILKKAILVKKKIIENDEKELGLRKILNFGHTIGHALESCYQFQEYLHGECVAIGMLAFIRDDSLKQQLLEIYKGFGLPTYIPYNTDLVYDKICNDKKTDLENIHIIELYNIGIYKISKIKLKEIKSYL